MIVKRRGPRWSVIMMMHCKVVIVLLDMCDHLHRVTRRYCEDQISNRSLAPQFEA
jgi:hypothetical protein